MAFAVVKEKEKEKKKGIDEEDDANEEKRKMFLSTQDKEKLATWRIRLRSRRRIFYDLSLRIVTIIAATVVVVGKRTTNGRSRP